MLIDRPRLIILSTVPITMAINFLLLNHFFGSSNTKFQQHNQYSTSTEIKETQTTSSVKTTPVFFRTNKKLKIAHFPPPPAHTFAGNEYSEMTEEKENFNNQGVIIK